MVCNVNTEGQRHHFVPQFYLRAWNEPGTGLLWKYERDVRGRLRASKRSAKSMAYQHGLYSGSHDGVGLSMPVELEHGFFAQLDKDASVVHQKLLTCDIDVLSDCDRRTWALFLNSLIERTPDRISALRDLAADAPDQAIAELRRTHAASMAAPVIQRILHGLNKEAYVRNAVLASRVNATVDQPFLCYLANMTWVTLDSGPGEHHFLTSDNPLVVNCGASMDPVQLLSIALSPQRLLVLINTAPDKVSNGVRDLALVHNVLIVKQAKKTLVSSRLLRDTMAIKYTQIAELLVRAAESRRVPNSAWSRPA